MKFYLPLFLLLATGCGSKTQDPAVATDPNADVIPAGQHVIRTTTTGTGWDTRDVGVYLSRLTARSGERAIYKPVADVWRQSGGDKTLRLAYRDTTANLEFSCAMSPSRPNGAPMPAGAMLTLTVYVDNRLQGQVQLAGTAPLNYADYIVQTKNLK